MLYHIILKNDICVSINADKFEIENSRCDLRAKNNKLIAMISTMDIVSISHFTDSLAENEVFDYENPLIKKGGLYEKK